MVEWDRAIVTRIAEVMIGNFLIRITIRILKEMAQSPPDDPPPIDQMGEEETLMSST